mgnify:CR=1 FL=1
MYAATKETNQFETRRLTCVVHGCGQWFSKGKKTNGFVSEIKCFRSKSRKKWKDIETEDNNIDALQNKLKLT